MKFWEAMREMTENGKKVRQPDWRPIDNYVFFDGNVIKDDQGTEIDMFNFYRADGWELYEEPKLTFKDLKVGDIFKSATGDKYQKVHDDYVILLNSYRQNYDVEKIESN